MTHGPLVRGRHPAEGGSRGTCSFNPGELAIHLEQVAAGAAPEEDRDPVQLLARTSFARVLGEHSGVALRRLAGETANVPAVMALVTCRHG